MYNILVVEDEPNVLDEIISILKEHYPDYEFFGVDDVQEAVDIFHKRRIDILITDVQMPKMSGLQLAEMVNNQWPNCRMIILTGYDHFNYIQSAMRVNCIAYVLKADFEEELHEAIHKSIEEIRVIYHNESLLEQAKDTMRQAVESLQQEMLHNLILGEHFQSQELGTHFERLHIPLCTDSKVYCLLGKIDHWNKYTTFYDRSLMLFALNNIAIDIWSKQFISIMVRMGERHVAWLMQPVGLEGSNSSIEDDWKKRLCYLHQMLESMQNVVMNMLSLPVSFLVGNSAVSWSELAQEYGRLQLLSHRSYGLTQEIIHDSQKSSETNSTDRLRILIRNNIAQIDRLRGYLDNGERVAFFTLFDEITLLEYLKHVPYTAYAMLYTHLTSVLFTVLNRMDDSEQLLESDEWTMLGNMDSHGNWPSAVTFIRDIAARIFYYQSKQQKDYRQVVIDQVENYISGHLSEDLSLTRLADMVHLNKTYLSKLYKQATGVGLSDYILEIRLTASKELLLRSQMKIQDITMLVGLESAAYFARLFRKATGMTPKEYRESI